MSCTSRRRLRMGPRRHGASRRQVARARSGPCRGADSLSALIPGGGPLAGPPRWFDVPGKGRIEGCALCPQCIYNEDGKMWWRNA